MKVENYDFCGYATKSNILCSDGRTIAKDAFKDDSGKKVPLLFQHLHDDPANILGHAVLENREDGVYAYGFFNKSEKAQLVKEAVAHGDLDSLSIYANGLSQNGKTVVHGIIRELSVVLAGANPGATIENISFAHADGSYAGESDDEAIIKLGLTFDKEDEAIEHADSDLNEDATVGEVFETLTDIQKKAVYSMLLDVAGESIKHSEEGGEDMKENVFDAASKNASTAANDALRHDAFAAIVKEAIDTKSDSLKDVFLSHKATDEMPNGQPGIDYGIENIDYLFPDYRNVRQEPDMIKREDAWVSVVMNGTSKTPFSRIKTMTADITAEVARARGYRKGHLKKEEVIKLAKRVTGPTTIYKKQRLDRDDIIDITDMDVVSWLKREMQMMLREECARAILLGDGRPVLVDGKDNPDKIEEDCIRPIYKENELYAYHVDVNLGKEDNESYISIIKQIGLAMLDYKGSGNPILFTSKLHHYNMLNVTDELGRPLYQTEQALLGKLNGISRIVEIPFDVTNEETGKPLFGIIVDLRDYTVGTNRGGQTTFFDDFDIDFNQYKYLYETRFSGALTRVDSAVILEGVYVSEYKVPVVGTPGDNNKPTTTNDITGVSNISDVQEDVTVVDGVVNGVLKHTEAKGTINGKEVQPGYWVILNVDKGSATKVEHRVINGYSKPVFTEIQDATSTIAVKDPMTQKVQHRYTYSDGHVDVKTLSLAGLTLLPPDEE